MELTIALALSIIGTVISVSNFVLSRKDKNEKDSKEDQKQFSKHDLIEYQLKELKEDVKTILAKLEKYENDIDDRVSKAIDLHVRLYHNEHKGVK